MINIFHTKKISETKDKKNKKSKRKLIKRHLRKFKTLAIKKEEPKQQQLQQQKPPQLKFTYSKHQLVRNSSLVSLETRFDQESINAYDLSGLKPIHVVFLSSKNPQETAKKLQNLGAELNSLTTNGETALHMLCKSENQDLESLRFLLENKIDVDVQNNSGQTALSYLCERTDCNPKFVEMLLQSGADPNLVRNDGCSPIMLTCRSKLPISIIKLLLDSNADLTLKSKSGRLPLHEYLAPSFSDQKINPKVVQLLVEKDNSLVNLVDTRGMLPMHLACRDGFNSPEIIEILINNGSQTNQLSKSGYAPLHFLCQSDQINLTSLRLLLNHEKIDLNIESTAKSYLGWNAIHFLCLNKSLNIQTIKEFYDKGMNFDLQTKNGLLTPIHIICKKRKFKNKKKKKKKKNSKNKKKKSQFIQYITSDDYTETDSNSNSNSNSISDDIDHSYSNSDIDLGLDNIIGSNSNSDSSCGLNEQNNQNNNNTNNISDDFNLGGDLIVDSDEIDENTITNLKNDDHQENSIIDVVTYLIENINIDLGLRDKNGKTAFGYLWEKQSTPKPEEVGLMKLFLSKGVKINKQHKEDLTLMEIITGKNKIIKSNLLIKAILIGLDPEKRNRHGMTALHIACCSKNRDINIIRQLLQYKVQTNVCDYYGQTALHLICKNDPHNIYKIKLLLNLSKINNNNNLATNVNQKDMFGLTALHHLCKKKVAPIESIQYLLENGADASITDHFGNNALLFACYSPTPNNELIKLFIEKKSDVNIKVNSGWLRNDTPLIACCKHSQNKEIISLLLKNGADPNARDKLGNTALHFLFSIKPLNINAILLLVKNNANLNSKNCISGNSPIHYVAKFKNLNQNFVNFLVVNDSNFNLQNDELKAPFDIMSERNMNIIKNIQKTLLELNESQTLEIKELFFKNFFSTELHRKIKKIKNQNKINNNLDNEKILSNDENKDKDGGDISGGQSDKLEAKKQDDNISDYGGENDEDYKQKLALLKKKIDAKKEEYNNLEKEFYNSQFVRNKLKQGNISLRKKNEQNLKLLKKIKDTEEKKNTGKILDIYKLYTKLKIENFKFQQLQKKLEFENNSLKNKLHN
ncbi:ankyrin repeat-containing protein [Anaeramoeba flamelloides]|uniref:Ankyrin repeat-containing protein n=1 Tax=Anaeramoeba flamelloides TaxID=1746091 RepID=A0ABQ8YUU6_9EUKA|nr:ankyrin repeat-containing protein [Anaeramoeba flamelloides]